MYRGGIRCENGIKTELGDHTGDNISELNRYFSEYSVIYWAWKNQEADYYGLMHYRRYLSFANRKFETGEVRQVIMPSMTPACIHACGLDREECMRETIMQYDMIVGMDHDVVDDECKDRSIKNAKQFWLQYHSSYLKPEEFDLMLELIRKYNPTYEQDTIRYFNGLRFRGFNCFIMKKELFYEFCEYVFPMLFEFHERVNRENNSTLTNRNVGYAGEWFYSIWVERKIREGKLRIKETQLICFTDTFCSSELKPFVPEKREALVMSMNYWNAHHVAATLRSVMDKADPDKLLDIIILHLGNTLDRYLNASIGYTVDQLKSMAQDYPNISIRNFNPAYELDRVELGIHTGIAKKEIWYPALLPWILKEYDRAVYLGESLYAENDIQQLFCIEMNGKTVAATMDLYFIAAANGYVQGFREREGARLGLHDLYNYYSSDVLLMDLAVCRDRYDLQNLIDQAIVHCPKTSSELINLLYQGDAQPMPQEWNAVFPLEPKYYELSEYFPEKYSLGAKNPSMVNLKTMSGIARSLRLPVVKKMLEASKSTPFYEEIVNELWSGQGNIMLILPSYDGYDVYQGLSEKQEKEDNFLRKVKRKIQRFIF